MKAFLTLKKDSKTFADCRTALDIPNDLTGPARYDGMLSDFAAIVRGEKENPFSYEYELELHRMIMYCCGLGTDRETRIGL